MSGERHYAGVEHYDRDEVWDPAGAYGDPAERQRAELIRDSIPPDARTILDVGCGAGGITNLLADRYDVTGLDIAPAALRHVRAPTVVGSADELPFADRSFDALVLAEVLEHLEPATFERARAEAARVAARSIVVTVPNRENLRASRVRCPECGEVFSPWRHYRSFSPRRLRGLFPSFELVDLRTVGPRRERATTLEGIVRGRLARGAPLPFPAVCPRCGERGRARQAGRQGRRHGHLRRTGIQLVVRPVRRARWLFARYERR